MDGQARGEFLTNVSFFVTHDYKFCVTLVETASQMLH